MNARCYKETRGNKVGMGMGENENKIVWWGDVCACMGMHVALLLVLVVSKKKTD